MTEPAADLMYRLGERFRGLGLNGLMGDPAYREHVQGQMRVQQYFEKCLALGLTAGDARMVLGRERALSAQYWFTGEETWARAWDQAIRHSCCEPYRPFPDRAEYLQALIRRATAPGGTVKQRCCISRDGSGPGGHHGGHENLAPQQSPARPRAAGIPRAMLCRRPPEGH